jgi:hypothetical protein
MDMTPFSMVSMRRSIVILCVMLASAQKNGSEKEVKEIVGTRDQGFDWYEKWYNEQKIPRKSKRNGSEKEVMAKVGSVEWYKKWYNDQKIPYVRNRVLALSRRISAERGGPIDNSPRGWFLKFLKEIDRGDLYMEIQEWKRNWRKSK